MPKLGVPKIELECGHCKSKFYKLQSQLTNGHGKFCTKKCYSASHWNISTKKCAKCEMDLPMGQFRIRFKTKSGKRYKYRNNACHSCELRYGKDRNQRLKDSPEWKAINASRAREYYHKNVEMCKAKAKVARNRPEAKARRREYTAENADKIRAQELVTKKRYQMKHQLALTDEYIIQKLCGVTSPELKETYKKYPDLIQAKRLQILLLRQTSQSKQP